MGALVKPEQPWVLQACTAYCRVWLETGAAMPTLVLAVVAAMLAAPVSVLVRRTLYEVLPENALQLTVYAVPCT